MNPPTDAPSLVFTGGPVYSDGRPLPGVDTVAVAGGRIVAIGPATVVLADRTAATEVVDLAGRCLLPGFQDAHVHPAFAGLDLLHCDLRGDADVEGYRAAVAAYAATHPDEAWLTGGGWVMDAFEGGRPHRRLLDDVVNDRPVYLTNADAHGAWVNTRALEAAGIDAATPDPPDGHVQRDADGSPTGLLHEGATALLARHLPAVTDADRLAALLLAQTHLHAVGVTAWQDAIVGDYLGWRSPLGAYLDAADHDRLSARVTAALWWDRRRGLEQVDELVATAVAARRERFAPTVVKVMLDGMVETATAAMLHPYCGTEETGSAFLEGAALREAVTALVVAGFAVHFHACGDRSVREALDAVAAAGPPAPGAPPHQIAHVDVVHPDDVARFPALGVTANIQALWASHDAQIDQFKLPKLGPERTGWCFPFGSLHAAGAHLAAGSDWGVSAADPMAAVHTAVNRRRLEVDADPWLPEQALARRVALAAYSTGSARANGIDAETGTIATGKWADLVVLDRDLGTVPDHELAEVTVDGTWVAGRAVHRA